MNFIDLLDTHHIPYRRPGEHHHATAGHIQFDCPWCSPKSGRFRMGYSIEGNYVACWTCGGHSLAKTLRELTGSVLSDKLLLNLDLESPKLKIKGSLKLPFGIADMTQQHRGYLKGRGFDPDMIAEVWGVKGIGIAPQLAWHLFIPITQEGKVVSWTTRSISKNTQARYHNAPISHEAVPMKSLLYGEEKVMNAVVVCEGPTDVWAIGPGAIATMGVKYTTAQVEKIAKYTMRCVCFDAEADAQKRAEKLCRRLEMFPGVTMNVILSGKDPASSPRSEIVELRKRVLT